MQIDKVFFKGVEVSKEKAQELYNTYVKDYMTKECFFGGMAINTPDGVLQAEVSLAH